MRAARNEALSCEACKRPPDPAPKPLAENDKAWRLFWACRTQWAWASEMTAAAGASVATRVATGLPAERVEAKARALGITVDSELLYRFEILEEEAMAAMRGDEG